MKKPRRGPTLLDFLKQKQANDGSKALKAPKPVEEKAPKRPLEGAEKIENKIVNLIVSKKVDPQFQKFVNSGDRRYAALAQPRREAGDGEYYLLQVVYDGKRNKAVLLLYDEERHEVVEWVDAFGHKPYFLTNLTPEEIRKLGLHKHQNFAGMEVVYRYDLLHFENRKLTKIYTTDPLAVRELREKVPKAWEAKIKYHDNYTYDIGLVPTLKYKIKNNKLFPVPYKVSEGEVEKVLKAFEEESDEFKRLAISWIPIFEAPPPTVKAIAIDIEVFTPAIGRIPDPETAQYPVISVALSSNDGLKKVLVLIRENLKLTEDQLKELAEEDYEVEFYDSEKSMLIEVMRIIRDYPVLLTYNGDNFDLAYLYNRALKLGIPKEMIIFKKGSDKFEIKHGIHIDLYRFYDIAAIKTYAFGNKYKEVNLDAVAGALLGEHKVQLTKSISELNYYELAHYNFRDANLTLKLFTFNDYLPWKLMVLIARISKLGIEDLTRKQVSAWIKNLFFWEHRRRKYLIPNKEDIISMKGTVKSSAIIKGKSYQGAFVFEPSAGIFFNVVVLDFASLYPTIIKQYNISYETVNAPKCKNYYEVPEVGHRICKDVEGITSQIVGLLRDYRVKIYKKKAKDKSLDDKMKMWYDTVQSAMKVYINASYGVLGAESFELYCPPAAESITAYGRFAIKSTMDYAKKNKIAVLYGDTDSMFLWDPPQNLLDDIIEWVKNNFGLEIEIDKTYRFVAFTGLKKNYIGVYPGGEIDVKGLLGKKRNTPQFVKEAFIKMIEMIRNSQSPEEVVKTREEVKNLVKELYMNLKRQYYDLDELAFHMQLTKPIESYTKNMPQHVKAAKMLAKFGIHVNQGDVVSFVKVKGAEGVKPVQLAKLPEVDVEKYYEAIESTLGQILKAFSLDAASLSGTTKLMAFLNK
ncbi:DNA-directed DNA polymerase I [Ignicoccus hospitalis]|uniref:DNA polymerase n=1 Tax=Ignicoccus hospitalis (strain KIN4/I / DSM 18386 / JCM 14125) TaxID=453591 RepID=A8AAC0_IGNH4|nr:DNA-directed DNA polymerase I [Ignicoccus hospitalis]ABU81872.1 replicative DNA polymerase I [Ignicoccus hospitalis KIN4/I]HIH90140.1 DNA-directed DNA polymerase I [Desulfurococcaceae archaeon]